MFLGRVARVIYNEYVCILHLGRPRFVSLLLNIFFLFNTHIRRMPCILLRIVAVGRAVFQLHLLHYMNNTHYLLIIYVT